MEERNRVRNKEYEKLEKEVFTYETIDSYQNPREKALQSYTMEEYMTEIEREKAKNKTRNKENLERGSGEERRR